MVQPTTRITKRTLLVGAVSLTVVLSALFVWDSTRSHDPTELIGARLGMTVGQLRRSLPNDGEWSSETLADGLTILMLERSLDPHHARFEFHEGLLVAIRVESVRALRAPFVSDEAVLKVENLDEDRIRTSLIARNCPVHAAEIDAILAKP